MQAFNCLLTWEAFWWRLHLQVREKKERWESGEDWYLDGVTLRYLAKDH